MRYFFFFFPIAMLTVGCSNSDIDSILSEGPGTLGATAIHELSCSESAAGIKVDQLLESYPFKISIEDTNTVGWWKRGGYDFLNYKCISINKKLYMITIDSDNSITDISIRSFYNRSRKEWMFVTQFTKSDYREAEKAMDFLLKNLPDC